MPRPLLNVFLASLLLLCTALIPLADAEDPLSPPGPLARFAFLVGTWHAEHNADFVEEIWSAPHSNAMMGMFRMVTPEGNTRLYEQMTITHTPQTMERLPTTTLRLRHFTSDLVAWEEKDAPVTLTLAPSDPDEDTPHHHARFDNLDNADDLESITFSSEQWNSLTVTVAFREESGQKPLVFNFTRHDGAQQSEVEKPHSHIDQLDIPTSAPTPWKRITDLNADTLVYNPSFDFRIRKTESDITIERPAEGAVEHHSDDAVLIAPIPSDMNYELGGESEFGPITFIVDEVNVGSLWIIDDCAWFDVYDSPPMTVYTTIGGKYVSSEVWRLLAWQRFDFRTGERTKHDTLPNAVMNKIQETPPVVTSEWAAKSVDWTPVDRSRSMPFR